MTADLFNPAEIVWEEPPPKPERVSRYEPFFAALKAKPGAWARWPGSSNSPSIPASRKAEGFRSQFRVIEIDGAKRNVMWVVYEPAGEPDGQQQPESAPAKARASRK